jgi:hypothetical protein
MGIWSSAWKKLNTNRSPGLPRGQNLLTLLICKRSMELIARTLNKSGEDFVEEFQKVFNTETFPVLEAIPVEVEVVPDPNGQLVVVRA